MSFQMTFASEETDTNLNGNTLETGARMDGRVLYHFELGPQE